MFSTFFQKTIQKINFENLQSALKNQNPIQNPNCIISTLPIAEQDCLIKSTLPYDMEEKTINGLLSDYDFTSKTFIIYGKNTNDETAEKKYHQIVALGFHNVYLYPGGLFEWMLLQDIYGHDEFPTTKKVLDLLKFRPKKANI